MFSLMRKYRTAPATMGRFHPLVMTLVIYALSDVAFSGAVGVSAYHMDGMWSNPYYPLLHSGILMFSIMSVYFIAFSNIKLALSLHGMLKFLVLLLTLHSVCFPEFYQINKQEGVAICLYYLLTLVFEMTAFFVINKMNIPFFADDDGSEYFEDEDEVMATCC
ncbi:hypothetical protein L5515_018825 [Caenorhabditis briggsae]|uniref:Uncharacterized protein n=1 Tax=Caenorhabditis briggsae TaxID=6238 RepID=A0AAE9FK76_CAEBR|nr:hypothetical protein L5515_018825 [Caenorhabditis briggsae]